MYSINLRNTTQGTPRVWLRLHSVFMELKICTTAWYITTGFRRKSSSIPRGNRDHRVTDGAQNRACNRGNETLSAVSNIRSTAPVNCSRVECGQTPCAVRPAGVSSDGWRMSGKHCHECTDRGDLPLKQSLQSEDLPAPLLPIMPGTGSDG